MRAADAVTLIRVLVVAAVAYLILLKFNPIAITIIIAVAVAMDAIDGYFAVREASRGKIGFMMYLKAVSGDKKLSALVHSYKKQLPKISKYGARMDVAGDRAAEYILWITYAIAGIVPLFVIIIVVMRHSFVDAVMAARGTSSKMKTKFARTVYSSNLFRGGANVVKFLTFSYLAFVYSWGYPIWIGYVLIGVLVFYILLRGAAELYEAYHGE